MHTPQKTSLQWQNRRICAGNTSSSFLGISNTFKHQWLCYRLRLCGFTYERPKHNKSSPRPVYWAIFTDVLHTKTKQWRTLNWLAVQPDQFLGLQEQKQPSQMQKLLELLLVEDHWNLLGISEWRFTTAISKLRPEEKNLLKTFNFIHKQPAITLLFCRTNELGASLLLSYYFCNDTVQKGFKNTVGGKKYLECSDNSCFILWYYHIQAWTSKTNPKLFSHPVVTKPNAI